MSTRKLQYISSCKRTAKVAHLLASDLAVTACGAMFSDKFNTTPSVPAGMSECGKCRRAALRFGWVLAPVSEKESFAIDRSKTALLDRILKSFVEGTNDRETARCLGISERTLNRYTADSMRAAGASTRFQWGYLLALRQHEQAQKQF